MSSFNPKDIIQVREISYLDQQERYYENNLSSSPPIYEQRHPAIVLSNLILNNEECLIVGKLQTYDPNREYIVRQMDRELEQGTAIKLIGRQGPNRESRVFNDSTINDSYFFSGEIYLVRPSENQAIAITEGSGENLRNVAVEPRTFLKVNLLVAEKHTRLMQEPYMNYIIRRNVVDNFESLDYRDVFEYNRLLGSKRLISTQYIDKAITDTLHLINQQVNHNDYFSINYKFHESIYKLKEFVFENINDAIHVNVEGYLKELNERYNVYEAYNNKFVRDLSNSNVGQFLRDNDILPEQVEKFSIGYFTNLSTSESIELFKSQITNESLLSEINISDIDFDERVLGDRLTIPITNKYDRITGFVAIDYTGDKDIPILYSKSIDDPVLRIDNNVFNLNRVDSNTITLVDNPLDVIKLDSLGINNAVCYLGNDYNDLAKQLQEKGINEVNISFKNNSYYEIKALDIGKSLNDLNINTNINLYNEESIRDNFNFNKPNFINYNDFSNDYYQKLTQNPYANMEELDLKIELESNINNYVKDVLIPKAEKFYDISYIDSQTIKTNLLINDSISNPQGLEYLSNIRSISTVSNTNPNDITKKIENKFNEVAKERNLDLDLNNNRIMQQPEIDIMR